jgi:signal transduction histidine kinase
LRASVGQVRDLAGRLISAQEAERAHIARELHDGVSQHVAAMAIALSAMKSGPAERSVTLDQEVERLQSHTTALFESVRDLSHQLHPSVLKRAGLVTAMRSLCSAVSEHHEIDITLRADDIGSVPEVPALCIYRVTQEALRNAVAHSGAKNISVVLARHDDRLSLAIADDGRGFDTATARRRGGLGLVSIEERVRLEQGDLVVDSDNSGTRIRAWLPLGTVA